MDSPQNPLIVPNLRNLQIVTSCLLLGVLVLLAIVLVLSAGQVNRPPAAPAGPLPLVTLVALIWFVVDVPVALLLPSLLTRSALRRLATERMQGRQPIGTSLYATDAAKLLGIRQTTLIIRLALLESVALFGCIAYLVDQQPLVLAIVVLALLLMASSFPTENRVLGWFEQQSARLEELRQTGAGLPSAAD